MTYCCHGDAAPLPRTDMVSHGRLKMEDEDEMYMAKEGREDGLLKQNNACCRCYR